MARLLRNQRFQIGQSPRKMRMAQMVQRQYSTNICFQNAWFRSLCHGYAFQRKESSQWLNVGLTCEKLADQKTLLQTIDKHRITNKQNFSGLGKRPYLAWLTLKQASILRQGFRFFMVALIMRGVKTYYAAICTPNGFMRAFYVIDCMLLKISLCPVYGVSLRIARTRNRS